MCVVSGDGGSGQMTFVRWVWHVDEPVVRVELCAYPSRLFE